MVEQCDKCGKCCKSIPCSIGLALLGDHRPCKALELEKDGTFSCGLVKHTSEYVNIGRDHMWKDEFLGHLFSHMIGIGLGCCSSPHTDLVHAEMGKKLRELKFI